MKRKEAAAWTASRKIWDVVALHKKCRIIDFSGPPLRSLGLCG